MESDSWKVSCLNKPGHRFFKIISFCFFFFFCESKNNHNEHQRYKYEDVKESIKIIKYGEG